MNAKVCFLIFASLAALLCVQCYPSPAAAAAADEQLVRRINGPPNAVGAPPLPAGVAGPGQPPAASALNQETLKGESSYGYGYAYPYYGYYYPRYYAYGYGYPYYSYYNSHYYGWPYYR